MQVQTLEARARKAAAEHATDERATRPLTLVRLDQNTTIFCIAVSRFREDEFNA